MCHVHPFWFMKWQNCRAKTWKFWASAAWHIYEPILGGLAVSKFQRCFYWVVATQIFFMFIPILGEMIQFDSYFSDGLKPPSSLSICFYLHPWNLTWKYGTWKEVPGNSEIPNLETIIFRFHVKFRGSILSGFRLKTTMSSRISWKSGKQAPI